MTWPDRVMNKRRRIVEMISNLKREVGSSAVISSTISSSYAGAGAGADSSSWRETASFESVSISNL